MTGELQAIVVEQAERVKPIFQGDCTEIDVPKELLAEVAKAIFFIIKQEGSAKEEKVWEKFPEEQKLEVKQSVRFLCENNIYWKYGGSIAFPSQKCLFAYERALMHQLPHK